MINNIDPHSIELSILMPVNQGEQFIEETIDSILSQSFLNFELIILDNQSTDKSSEIIKKFLRKDKRVKYILDYKKRNGNDCFLELAKYIKGEYVMEASDDNIFNKDFCSKLVNFARKNLLDTAFANGFYISEDKKILGKFFNKKKNYLEGNFNIKKILIFCFKGDVMPLILSGLIKTPIYKSFLPKVNLSRFENDADTLYGIQIMTNCKIGFLNEDLLFCRVYDVHERFHDAKYKLFDNDFLEKITHEMRLLKNIYIILDKSHQLKIKILTLKLIIPFVLLLKYFKSFLIKIIFYLGINKFFKN
jgi:glycosyltransferase involved in cell wall biosynthesis